MIFKLTTSSYFYYYADIHKYEALGFTFVPLTQPSIDGNLHIAGIPEIEIKTLKQLQDLQKQIDHPLIFFGTDTIEIYDDFRE